MKPRRKASRIALVDGPHSLQVDDQRPLRDRGEHGNTVLVALPFSYQDLVAVELDVLHP